MGDFEGQRRLGRNGTDVAAYEDVIEAITLLVRARYGGWSLSDRQDLEQQVLVKYFQHFGRYALPDDEQGNPAVPFRWLKPVIRNAGVDFHRRQEARPELPADFQGSNAFVLEGLLNAVDQREKLSVQVADRVDQQRLLIPALQALHASHPMDIKVLEWRFVQDKDFEYIGEILNKSPDAAKKSVQRAVKRLRDLMATNSVNADF